MAERTAGRRVRPAMLARELDRLIADVAGSVDGVVDHAHPAPEALHELHREMRRLRHALAIWERLLAHRQSALLIPLDRRLKRLSRLIGRVRDRDVVIELLEGTSLPRVTREEGALVGRLRSRLQDDARTGRELLRVFLRSERDAHLFEGLREGLELPPRRGASTDLAAVLDDERQSRHDGVRTARRRARRHASSLRLHQLRIRVRRLRHLAEVRTHLDGMTIRRTPSTVRRLQSRLGRLHDLDIVLDVLDPDLESTRWAEALRKERRAIRDGIRDSIRTQHWPDLPIEPPPARPVRPHRRRTSS